MAKRNFIELFESRKGHLDYRLKRDYVRNGIATIPCRVSDYSDVISAYSVKGCETLNPEFDAYLKSTAELMPPECPLQRKNTKRSAIILFLRKNGGHSIFYYPKMLSHSFCFAILFNS